ncbi:sortase [Candidatus Saccharibacteria bacterium]|nr:sortase [Candidatus Saccharibacteria bacterium]
MKQLLAVKWRLLPLLLAAVILAFPFVRDIWTRNRVLSSAKAAEASLRQTGIAKIEGTPVRLLIPSLSIDLPVVPQSYSPVIKTWQVAPGLANYAAESALANNFKGETLLYGHNNRSVFGPVLKMKSGDVAYVYTDNGHIFKYSFESSRDIAPTRTDIFSEMAESPAGLRLVTCDGPNFEYRRVASLKLLQAT